MSLKIAVGVGGKLDLTTWDFSKAECDTKLVECSKPLLLIGWIPIRHRARVNRSGIDRGMWDNEHTREFLHVAFHL